MLSRTPAYYAYHLRVTTDKEPARHSRWHGLTTPTACGLMPYGKSIESCSTRPYLVIATPFFQGVTSQNLVLCLPQHQQRAPGGQDSHMHAHSSLHAFPHLTHLAGLVHAFPHLTHLAGLVLPAGVQPQHQQAAAPAGLYRCLPWRPWREQQTPAVAAPAPAAAFIPHTCWSPP